jgi:hypothetical protein
VLEEWTGWAGGCSTIPQPVNGPALNTGFSAYGPYLPRTGQRQYFKVFMESNFPFSDLCSWG